MWSRSACDSPPYPWPPKSESVGPTARAPLNGAATIASTIPSRRSPPQALRGIGSESPKKQRNCRLVADKARAGQACRGRRSPPAPADGALAPARVDRRLEGDGGERTAPPRNLFQQTVRSSSLRALLPWLWPARNLRHP